MSVLVPPRAPSTPDSARGRRAVLLLLIAVICRLVFLAYYWDGPIIQPGTLVRHVSIARSLVAGYGVHQESAFGGPVTYEKEGYDRQILPPSEWPPVRAESLGRPLPTDTIGFAMLLAGTWAITGETSFVWVQLIQILLDCLVALALVSIVGTLTASPRSAWAVGVLYAVFLPAARMAVNPHRDAWAIFGAVFSLALALRFIRGRSWGWAGAAGVVFAVCTWMRPTLVPLGVAMPIALLLHPRLRRGRVVVAGVAIAAASGLIFWIPFVAYNQRTYGVPLVFIRGLGRWTSYGDFPNPYGAGPTDQDAGEYVREQGFDYPSGSIEWDAVLERRVEEIDAVDPTLKYRNALRRLPQTFLSGFTDVFAFPREYQQGVYLSQSGHTMFTYVRDHPFVAFARFGVGVVFWTLALIGVGLSWRSWRSVAVLATAPAYAVALASYYHFENRNIVVGMWGALYFVIVSLQWLPGVLRPAARGGTEPQVRRIGGDASRATVEASDRIGRGS